MNNKHKESIDSLEKYVDQWLQECTTMKNMCYKQRGEYAFEYLSSNKDNPKNKIDAMVYDARYENYEAMERKIRELVQLVSICKMRLPEDEKS